MIILFNYNDYIVQLHVFHCLIMVIELFNFSYYNDLSHNIDIIVDHGYI